VSDDGVSDDGNSGLGGPTKDQEASATVFFGLRPANRGQQRDKSAAERSTQSADRLDLGLIDDEGPWKLHDSPEIADTAPSLT
jgi:hypothetical protein